MSGLAARAEHHNKVEQSRPNDLQICQRDRMLVRALPSECRLGVLDSTGEFTVLTTVPSRMPVIEKPFTTPAAPIETPLESQTRNFAGTVLPCLKTLVPLPEIGARI